MNKLSMVRAAQVATIGICVGVWLQIALSL
jgi:hypothetical protein